MTQQTMCPACGAPLVYEGEKDVVHCGFCSTDISVIREDDSVRFEVLAQPEPQKEVLSHVVEPPYEAPQDPDAVVEEQSISDFPSFFSSESSSEPVPPPPTYNPPPGAQVYQPVTPAPASTTSRNWILITLGIVVGLCLLCACLAGAGVLLFSISLPAL